MAVTIKQKEKPKAKTKGKAKAKAVSNLHEAEELVDAIGLIQEQMKPLQEALAPLTKQYSKLNTDLLEIVDKEFAAESKTTLVGENYSAEVGAKGNSTIITDMEQAQKTLEQVEEGLFLLLAKVGITELRQYLTPKQLEKITETNRTGKRRVKVTTL